MLLSLALMVVVCLGAPYILRIWPDLPPNCVWLLRALSLDLVLTAARVVPTMLMERHLQYGRLSLLEVFDGTVLRSGHHPRENEPGGDGVGRSGPRARLLRRHRCVRDAPLEALARHR